MLETARRLDRLGYDLIGIQDHPYQAAHLDTLSLLGVILAQNSTVRVFADVGDLPLRSPDERTLTTFITDVAPAVREQVADVRARSSVEA